MELLSILALSGIGAICLTTMGIWINGCRKCKKLDEIKHLIVISTSGILSGSSATKFCHIVGHNKITY